LSTIALCINTQLYSSVISQASVRQCSLYGSILLFTYRHFLSTWGIIMMLMM